MTVRDDTAVLLALFDEEQMTEAAIAKATGLARPQVTASLAVARSQAATSAAERWDFLTLDQAAALAEFEDDQEALTALVQAAKGSPSQFSHLAAQLRATRAQRETKTAFAAGLQAQGIAVYGERPYVPWTLALENLRDGDGNDITPGAHATCPGRAVAITYEWDWAPAPRRPTGPRTTSPAMATCRHRLRQRRGSTRGRVRARLAGRAPPVHRPRAVRPR